MLSNEQMAVDLCPLPNKPCRFSAGVISSKTACNSFSQLEQGDIAHCGDRFTQRSFEIAFKKLKTATEIISPVVRLSECSPRVLK